MSDNEKLFELARQFEELVSKKTAETSQSNTKANTDTPLFHHQDTDSPIIDESHVISFSTAIEGLDHDEKLELQQAADAIKFLADIKQHLSENDDTSIEPNANSEFSNLDKTSLPKHLGRFEIIRQLGQGGFGKVLLAKDPLLSRFVALKVPNPSTLFSDEAVRRFELEAKATSILTHPFIVPVFESAQHGPFTFLVSSYCPGPTLHDWFEKQHRNIDPQTAAAVIANLATGVHHAHQRGVIHRDLKPSNILIEIGSNEADLTAAVDGAPMATVVSVLPESEIADRVRITDFGLARCSEQRDQSLTKIGAVVGTPAYMSPEQADGVSEVNFACDIFSLGTIFYELLTGKSPFQKDKVVSTLQAVSSSEPVRPGRLNKKVDRDLEAICLKCLEKKPGSRYESAHHLADDLNRWLAEMPIKARPATQMERLKKWSRRNPALAAACMALGVAFVVMAIGYLLAIAGWREAEQQRARAEEQFSRAEQHLSTTRQTINDLVSAVARDSSVPFEIRLKVSERATMLQNKLLEDEPDNYAIRQETAVAYISLALVLEDHSQPEASIEALDFAENLLKDIPSSDEVSHFRIVIRQNKAIALRTLGRFNEALAIVEADLNKEAHQSRYNWASQLMDVGSAHFQNKDQAGARMAYEQSRLLFENLEKKNIFTDASHAALLRLMGQLELEEKQFSAADELLTESYSILKKTMAVMPFHQEQADEEILILNHLASVNLATGNTGNCRPHANSSIQKNLVLLERGTFNSKNLNSLSTALTTLMELEIKEKEFVDVPVVLASLNTAWKSIKRKSPMRLNFGFMLGQFHLSAADEARKLEFGEVHAQQIELADELVKTLLLEFPDDQELKLLRARCDDTKSNQK